MIYQERTLRNNRDQIILFNHASKDIESLYRGAGGYDMSCEEYKQLCRKSWEEEYNYLCIDITKKKDRRKFCTGNESKNTYIECNPETTPF